VGKDGWEGRDNGETASIDAPEHHVDHNFICDKSSTTQLTQYVTIGLEQCIYGDSILYTV
jgi:hypothetical protein